MFVVQITVFENSNKTQRGLYIQQADKVLQINEEKRFYMDTQHGQ